MQEIFHNTLMHRELLPPPIAKVEISGASRFARFLWVNNLFCPPAASSFKHCCRVFLCLFLLIFAFSSCKNEEIHFVEISEYFAESCHLDVVEQDSITRFAHKVAAFVALNPLAKEDPLYPRILHNIQTSSFTITWDTAWKDTIDISNK